MVAFACLRHWYESMIFFGPVPIVGIWVWLSGRRHAAEDGDDRSGGTPPPSAAG